MKIDGVTHIFDRGDSAYVSKFGSNGFWLQINVWKGLDENLFINLTERDGDSLRPKTYLQSNSVDPGVRYEAPGGVYYMPQEAGKSFIITITSLTKDRIAGTFSGNFYTGIDTITTKAFTEGQFNLTLIRNY